MKRFPIILAVLALAACNSQNTEENTVKNDKNHIYYVNPIIGTNGMGHTFPGACAPYGIVQLSPDTDTIPFSVDGEYQPRVYEYCAGYQHKDSTIVGFSHTHFSGTGHSDLGDILVMPTTGEVKLNPGTQTSPDGGYRSRFSHETEISKPGYYEVELSDYNIKAQLTATERVGVHKYSYPENENGNVILDLTHAIYNYDGKVLLANIRVENDTLITGYRVTNGWARTNYTYFAISFSKPIADYGYVEKDRIEYRGGWGKFPQYHNFPEMTGKKIVAYFKFEKPETLELKVALSAVSTDGALKNLKAETDGKNFEQLLAETQTKWNNELSVIDAQGTDDQLYMIYTSLYHTMINPSVYMDVDGRYRGLDHNIHHADGFTNYTVFSLWDTYRAFHPLMNIIQPKRNADFVQSMLKHYEQSVHHALPVWSHNGNENWCMIGYHAVPVLADALMKGVVKPNPKLIEAMNSSATIPYYVRLDEYMKLGYVPYDKHSCSASLTLEYAYDDWTIYNSALKMKELTGSNDYNEIIETYGKRAQNWRNSFDTELGFARPRYTDGSWKQDFSLLRTDNEGFVEGNSWNYSFYVPQDVNGLIAAMGGEENFIANLDSIFVMKLPAEFFENTEDVTEEGLMGNYVHGNEPSHHIAYLYNWTSEPYKTQYWIREIMNRMYKNNIDGLCGNDDCGQMSAWYIFSAMGFYPVCPGTDQYVFGAPYLPYMKVTLGNGKTLEIKAENVSDENRYVGKIMLNGKEITRRYITHSELMNGGTLEYEMVSEPNTSNDTEKPYSMTKQ